jgi:hypothetical protein
VIDGGPLVVILSLRCRRSVRPIEVFLRQGRQTG